MPVIPPAKVDVPWVLVTKALAPRLTVVPDAPERGPMAVDRLVELLISNVPVPVSVMLPVDTNVPVFARLRVPADIVVPPA